MKITTQFDLTKHLQENATEVFDLTSAEHHVLTMLSFYSGNKEGQWVCWPSQPTIAKKTALSRSTVGRAMKGLKDKGAISTHQRVDNSLITTIHPYKKKEKTNEPTKEELLQETGSADTRVCGSGDDNNQDGTSAEREAGTDNVREDLDEPVAWTSDEEGRGDAGCAGQGEGIDYSTGSKESTADARFSEKTNVHDLSTYPYEESRGSVSSSNNYMGAKSNVDANVSYKSTQKLSQIELDNTLPSPW